MVLKELLDSTITLELSRSQAKNFKCLLFCNESALNSQSLFGYLLPTFVTEFFHLELHGLLLNIF